MELKNIVEKLVFLASTSRDYTSAVQQLSPSIKDAFDKNNQELLKIILAGDNKRFANESHIVSI